MYRPLVEKADDEIDEDAEDDVGHAEIVIDRALRLGCVDELVCRLEVRVEKDKAGDRDKDDEGGVDHPQEDGRARRATRAIFFFGHFSFRHNCLFYRSRYPSQRRNPG